MHEICNTVSDSKLLCVIQKLSASRKEEEGRSACRSYDLSAEFNHVRMRAVSKSIASFDERIAKDELRSWSGKPSRGHHRDMPRRRFYAAHLDDCVGKGGVSEADRDGFEGKRPSP